MSKSLIKVVNDKLKIVPQTYKHSIQPFMQSTITTGIVKPCKSLLRLHLLKKAYNRKYDSFITFGILFQLFIIIGKAFLAVYMFFNFVQYDFGTASLVGRQVQQTEYATLVKKICQDSAGADMISSHAVEVINKGKKNGLLAIELNQLTYLLQPAEIAWQGRYLASLKA